MAKTAADAASQEGENMSEQDAPTRPKSPAELAESVRSITSRTGYQLVASGMGPFPCPTELHQDSYLVRLVRRLSYPEDAGE